MDSTVVPDPDDPTAEEDSPASSLLALLDGDNDDEEVPEEPDDRGLLLSLEEDGWAVVVAVARSLPLSLRVDFAGRGGVGFW